MSERGPLVHSTFPDGSVFIVRVEASGVIFDAEQKVVDGELATAMLLIKSLKLAQREAAGRA